MKEIKLNTKKIPLVKKGQVFFYEKDLDDSIRSCTPGEWVQIKLEKEFSLGFVNPFVQEGSNVVILNSKETSPETYISTKIERAIKKRELFGYQTGSRLIYGQSDDLPGLVVDKYENAAIIQISNAGMDIYREMIKEKITSLIDSPCFFLDNEKYRTKEGLPLFDKEELPTEISINECDLKYAISREQLQKIGYYYDHRENRLKLERSLQKINKDFKRGLDLFCYIGSWGLHTLRSGVEHVRFVDQANMKEVVENNLKLNNFSKERGEFIREDVFKFLDLEVSKGSRYDVIVCDPPAFNKSLKNKNKSLIGYEKLYQRIFKLLEENSVLAAASCTQNISLEDLDSAVQKMAIKTGRKVQLIDIGLQGWDHPIESLKSKSNYIKYLCYIVE